MDGVQQYILSVTIIALLCGILSRLIKYGSKKECMRLLSGLVLAITVLRPLARFRIDELNRDWFPDTKAGRTATEYGEKIAQEAMAEIIKAESESYILDKASEMNIAITANVTVSDQQMPVPIAVELAGTVPPYLRLRLEDMIQDSLGIAKEDQRWTG